MPVSPAHSFVIHSTGDASLTQFHSAKRTSALASQISNVSNSSDSDSEFLSHKSSDKPHLGDKLEQTMRFTPAETVARMHGASRDINMPHIPNIPRDRVRPAGGPAYSASYKLDDSVNLPGDEDIARLIKFPDEGELCFENFYVDLRSRQHGAAALEGELFPAFYRLALSMLDKSARSNAENVDGMRNEKQLEALRGTLHRCYTSVNNDVMRYKRRQPECTAWQKQQVTSLYRRIGATVGALFEAADLTYQLRDYAESVPARPEKRDSLMNRLTHHIGDSVERQIATLEEACSALFAPVLSDVGLTARQRHVLASYEKLQHLHDMFAANISVRADKVWRCEPRLNTLDSFFEAQRVSLTKNIPPPAVHPG